MWDKDSVLIDDKNLTKDDILSDLMKDDETPPDDEIKDDKEVETKTKEDEEEPEIKDEEKEEEELKLDEEDDEIVVPVRRKEILAKYPNIFKEFKHLEKALYRDQQFTEMFATPNDAKEVVEKAGTLDKFEADLLDGNIEKILSTVKNNRPDSFNKVVDNYLTTLVKVDKEAYYNVVTDVVENIIRNMVSESKNLGDSGKPLETAAQVLNQYMFGRSEFKPRERVSDKTDTSESDKIQKEREAFIQEKFESARDSLDNRIDNLLKSTIDANIDPKDAMTDYVKRNATREALESVKSLIDNDRQFQVIKDKLWERAFQDNFSKSSLEKIESAIKSKAKTVLKEVILKSRNEALKGLGKRVSDEKDRKGHVAVGRTSPEKKSPSKPNEIPKGMKTIDYLNMD